MNFDKLDQYLSSFYEEKNIPAYGCAVYYRHKPVYTKCFGYADVEKKLSFTKDNLLCLYSGTKISTAACAMILMEQGYFKLSDPVAKYLPELASLKVQAAETVDGDQLIPMSPVMTIEHLMSMSAGITYNEPEAMQIFRKEHPDSITGDDFLRFLADQPLIFQPGNGFCYSFCLDILGVLMERVTGKSLPVLYKELLFEPLGMNRTMFYPTEEQMQKDMAMRYYDFDHQGPKWRVADKGEINFSSHLASAGGGLVSCLSDYILLLETLTNFGVAPNGRRILSSESINAMRGNHLSVKGMKDFEEFGGTSKAGYSYGLGVRTLVDRERNNSLSANGEFGWDGALGCYFLCDPDSEISICYVQQEGGSQWWDWHGTIRNTVYACLF